jgi:hypothetical protein
MLVCREDDSAWPKKNIVGKQELEVRIDNEHISFEVSPPSNEGWSLRISFTELFLDIVLDRRPRSVRLRMCKIRKTLMV